MLASLPRYRTYNRVPPIDKRSDAKRGIVTAPALTDWLEAGETGGMKPQPDAHYRHGFRAEIISQSADSDGSRTSIPVVMNIVRSLMAGRCC